MALTKQAREFFVKAGRKGGNIAAKQLTAEERIKSARHAAQARWAKQKAELEKLTKEITVGTKELLRKTQKRQTALAKKKG
jgi:hypothetical protein